MKSDYFKVLFDFSVILEVMKAQYVASGLYHVVFLTSTHLNSPLIETKGPIFNAFSGSELARTRQIGIIS